METPPAGIALENESALKKQEPEDRLQDDHAIRPRESSTTHGGLFETIQEGRKWTSVIHESGLEEPRVVEIRDFNFWYGDAQALHGISMSAPLGRVTSLIGPSGCGKSTLLRCVNRMNDLIDNMRIDGSMHLNGSSIYDPDVDVIELRKQIGMVFQKPNPFPMSIYENVVYSLRIDGVRDRQTLDQACEQSLKSAGLWREVKDRLNTSALQLSGGQQQRLCIARAITRDAPVVILDEATASVDSLTERLIDEAVAELFAEHTVLVIAHRLSTITKADRILVLHHGRLCEEGTHDELLAQGGRYKLLVESGFAL